MSFNYSFFLYYYVQNSNHRYSIVRMMLICTSFSKENLFNKHMPNNKIEHFGLQKVKLTGWKILLGCF